MFRPDRPRALLLALSLLAAGCTQHMAIQPSYRTYQPSDQFADGASARPIPDDTVARGHAETDTALYAGKDSTGQDATTFPYPITAEILQRGQDRYDIYCSVCHGFAGDGDGVVVQRGFNPPPSYHTDQLRSAPVGHFFQVITNGFGAMPSYADQIPVDDRWAIVAYIRALQLSQDATLDDVPPDVRSQLEQQP
jgi:mono/diheme cytochrome c family protein